MINQIKNKEIKCSSCGSSNIKDVPAHCCLLWEKRDEAINCPKGDVQLNFCIDCGHLYNQVFNSELMEYTQNYENSLHFSPKFQEYSNQLITRLTETYNLCKDITFYFEVPNILYTLRDLDIWDLNYERCSYFSAPSISKLFEKANFEVRNVTENYMGQFLAIEANTQKKGADDYQTYVSVESVKELVEKFSTNFNQKITEWEVKLEQYRRAGKKIIAWGGGAKGVSFLNFLKTENLINEIVDINPRKQGMYIAGTGQKYVLPEELPTINPDVVILMNPIYKEEIADTLSKLNLHPEILVA